MDNCRKCGASLDNGIIFCPYCGVKVSEDATEESAREKLGFFEAFKIHWKKAFVFSGRTSLTEFWYSYIWTWIMIAAIGIVYFAGFLFSMILILGWLPAFILFTVATAALIVILIPLIASTTRRLHDTGRSAWWLFLILISMGIIPLVLCALKGDDDVNEYGERPIK